MGVLKKNNLVIFVVALCLLTGVAFFLKRNANLQEHKRNVLLSYRIQVKNSTNHILKNAALSVRVPIENTVFQHRNSIDANHSFKFSKDRSGQDMIIFSWDVFPPFATKIITIRNRLDVWENSRPTAEVDIEDYLITQPMIESENNEIQSLARRLKGESTQKTVQNTFDWVSEKIAYAGYIKRARGALYALKHRKGDCTEFAYLFVALSRANGIPARIVRGFVCPDSAVLDLGDYHEWAEFYHDGQWHLADPQRKRLMEEENTYIVFCIDQPPFDNTQSLVSLVEGKGLKVKLN